MALSLEQDRILKVTRAYGQLLAATGTTNGTWVELFGIHPVTVTVEGTFVGTFEIDVSNAPSPLNTEHGAPLDGGTVPTRTNVNDSYRWIKVRVTAYTSGTINAYCFAAG